MRGLVVKAIVRASGNAMPMQLRAPDPVPIFYAQINHRLLVCATLLKPELKLEVEAVAAA